MKTYLLKPMVVVCLCLLTASFTFAADNYKMVKVKAPFPMQPIKVFIYPDKDFLITDYGAKNGGKVNNTKAIAAAIEACHKSGGGRVVVPAGIWLTGPIHFKSNVNLYLEENAILNFTDNPSDYLPKYAIHRRTRGNIPNAGSHRNGRRHRHEGWLRRDNALYIRS